MTTDNPVLMSDDDINLLFATSSGAEISHAITTLRGNGVDGALTIAMIIECIAEERRIARRATERRDNTLDDACHAAAVAFDNHGISLNDDQLYCLNDTLRTFLRECGL